MSFEFSAAFYALFLLVVIVFISGKLKDFTHYFDPKMLQKIMIGNKNKKINFLFLLLSFIFLIIALARPVIKNKPIEVKTTSIDMIVAFDISKSMLASDVYPSRLKFAMNKFNTLLEKIKDEKIGVIGFSSRSFMVSPLTNDVNILAYLVNNLSTDHISTQGSDVYEALKSANSLLKEGVKKALIVFSDGTDTIDFSKEIEYARKNKIKVFVYNIATEKGGVIEQEDGGILKDKHGNIVVTRLNNNIKTLALESDGAYLEYSINSEDIEIFLDAIRTQFENKEEKKVTIINNEEFFYIPLSGAIFFYVLAINGFSFRRAKR